MRRFLQNLGVAARDHLGENVWVNIVMRQAAQIPGPVVVTDVRFLNEVRLIEEMRGALVRIVRIGADSPLEWIARNGGVSGEVVVNKVRESGDGYNAATGEYGDLVAQGVLDPVKVTRSALANAASITAMLLTTETLIVEKPADEAVDAHAGHNH